MKVLVTGSHGYIGTVLVRLLKKEGYGVLGLDTGFYSDGWLYGDKSSYSHASIHKDIRQAEAADFDGVDAVIHLAELSNDPLGTLNERVTYAINHEGTLILARAAKAAGVRHFVYFSSCSVYGASPDVVNEQSQTSPLTMYARCKLLNEQALLSMGDSRFYSTVMRNATAFGFSPRMRFDLVVNNLLGSAFVDQEIKLMSDGKAWRPLMHIEDLARAALRIISAPRQSRGQIFNVGDDRSNYTSGMIAEEIHKLLPSAKISSVPTNPDGRSYRVSFAKIKSVLGFGASQSLTGGILQLLDVFQKANLRREDFLHPNFTRLKKINELLDRQLLSPDLTWKKYPLLVVPNRS